MITESEIINELISSLNNDLIETKREIGSLQQEVEIYTKIINKLKEIKNGVEDGI